MISDRKKKNKILYSWFRALHTAITTQYVSGSSIKNRLILLYTINRFLGEAQMTEIDARQL